MNVLLKTAFVIVALCCVARTAPCQEFAKVESATYDRGADVSANVFDSGKAAWYGPDWDEGPKHQVRIAGFEIARKQVSMGEFARFSKGYRQQIESRGIAWEEDAPAVFVSWTEASEYCRWLSKRLNQTCRLPTEAEWEFAATNSKKLKLAGIADGVQEWCLDWWSPYKKTDGQLDNPRGTARGTVRVVRDGGGGSILENTQPDEVVPDYRLTDRSATLPDDRRSNLGFRIAIGNLPLLKAADDVPAHILPDVSNQVCEWKDSKVDHPWFRAGGPFINMEQTKERLPYWNRHHVPSLTWCDNGDLLATAFTAPFDNSDQMAILITRLRYGNEKWDAPKLFFVAPDRNVTSAALFNSGNGVMHHYNGIGNHHCEDFSMIKRISHDNGSTWSTPEFVHRFPTDAASPENPLGKPRLWPHMDLKSYEVNGKRMLVMSTDVGAGNELGTAIFSSIDDGDSWQEISRTGWQSKEFAVEGGHAGWIAGIHAPVERLMDGSLLAIGRSNNIKGFSPLSRSTDFGKSWTYSASGFPPILSGQRPVLMRLKEGPLLFIGFTDSSVNVRQGNIKGMEFTDSSGETRIGSGTFAAVSFDEGRTWSHRKLIPNWIKRPWKSRYSGYLSCVQTPDGMIHLVSSKFYYQFNLVWLKEPMQIPN